MNGTMRKALGITIIAVGITAFAGCATDNKGIQTNEQAKDAQTELGKAEKRTALASIEFANAQNVYHLLDNSRATVKTVKEAEDLQAEINKAQKALTEAQIALGKATQAEAILRQSLTSTDIKVVPTQVVPTQVAVATPRPVDIHVEGLVIESPTATDINKDRYPAIYTDWYTGEQTPSPITLGGMVTDGTGVTMYWYWNRGQSNDVSKITVMIGNETLYVTPSMQGEVSGYYTATFLPRVQPFVGEEYIVTLPNTRLHGLITAN